MNIGYICSNLFNIDGASKKGTDIFNHILINQLALFESKDFDITVFASGASVLPAKIESIDFHPSSADPKIISKGKHIMFELALISKAFISQEKFDLYHVNIGDGDLVMPFAAFVRKPILINLHNVINEDFTRRYFSLFKELKNINFISASDYQRNILPDLNYAATIHHGIDIEQFALDPEGGDEIMWAGRFIPGKGPDVALELALATKRKIRLFGIMKKGYEDWFEQVLQAKAETDRSSVTLYVDYERNRLAEYYQQSKLFLLPTIYEEAFGFVFVEAMACGTPVVAYARGAAPEVIKDGITGFLVNPADDDIRGNWIVKKAGIAGLREAIEKIYALPEEEYKRMRLACREHAAENFSATRMAEKYLEVYESLISKNNI